MISIERNWWHFLVVYRISFIQFPVYLKSSLKDVFLLVSIECRKTKTKATANVSKNNEPMRTRSKYT